MANIYKTDIYNYDPFISPQDYLIGTDSNDRRRTKSFRIGDITTSIIQQIGASNANKILSGNIIWVSGLTYYISEVVYFLDGELKVTQPALIVLDPADPTNPRKDVIYVDSNSEVGVEEGQASSSPAEPTLDGGTQIRFTVIDIAAGSTEPEGILERIVYKENLGAPDEFNTSTNDAVAISFSNAIDPNQGSLCIDNRDGSLNGTAKIISFTNPTILNLVDFTDFEFFLRLSEAVDNNSSYISVSLENTVSGQESDRLIIQSGIYNYDRNLVNEYQRVFLPLADITQSPTSFNKINIYLTNGPQTPLKIDDVRLVGGVQNPSIGNTFLNLLDVLESTYVGKAGYKAVVNNAENGMVLQKDYWIPIGEAEVRKGAGNIDRTIIENGDMVKSKFAQKDGLSYFIPYGVFDATLDGGNVNSPDSYVTDRIIKN